MIAFGCAITKPDEFQRCAEPGIRRAEEPGSARFVLPAVGSIAESYNAMLDRAAERDDLEALVLVHQDAEIVDADLCAKVREALRDPEVGLIGCVGALDVRSIAWWEGSVTLASFINRYEAHGGGDLASFSWSWDEAPPWAHTGEVETLDGFVLVSRRGRCARSASTSRSAAFHGYDLDYCLQVREAGRKVVTADFRAIHHRQIEMLPDPEEWIEAHIAVAEKWDGRMPGVGTAPGAWRERALRAEAERDVAGAIAHTKASSSRPAPASSSRGIAETRGSLSWRLTAPVRRLGAAR